MSAYRFSTRPSARRARTTRARDHARAPLLVLVVLDQAALLLQDRLGIPRAVALLAGRVHRIEPQEILGKGDGVLGDHARKDTGDGPNFAVMRTTSQERNGLSLQLRQRPLAQIP